MLGMLVWTAHSTCGTKQSQPGTVLPETFRGALVLEFWNIEAQNRLTLHLPRFLEHVPCPTCATVVSREERIRESQLKKKKRKMLAASKEWSVHSNKWTQLWVKRAVVIFRKGGFRLSILKNYDSKNYEIGETCNKGSGGNPIPGVVWKSTG